MIYWNLAKNFLKNFFRYIMCTIWQNLLYQSEIRTLRYLRNYSASNLTFLNKISTLVYFNFFPHWNTKIKFKKISSNKIKIATFDIQPKLSIFPFLKITTTDFRSALLTLLHRMASTIKHTFNKIVFVAAAAVTETETAAAKATRRYEDEHMRIMHKIHILRARCVCDSSSSFFSPFFLSFFLSLSCSFARSFGVSIV